MYPYPEPGYYLRTTYILGSLSKPRRRRGREGHQIKGLINRTIAVHVRYKYLCISLPSSAKQQREMTKFCVVYGTWTTTANFTYFHLEPLHIKLEHVFRAIVVPNNCEFRWSNINSLFTWCRPRRHFTLSSLLKLPTLHNEVTILLLFLTPESHYVHERQ